jgi:hypothetical protein
MYQIMMYIFTVSYNLSVKLFEFEYFFVKISENYFVI